MSFFRRLRRLRASVPVYRISSLRLIVVLTHLFRWHFYVWPRQLSLWGRLKTPVVGSSSTLHDLLIHCDIGSFFGPSGFHLGTGLVFQSMEFFHKLITFTIKGSYHTTLIWFLGPAGFRFGTGLIFQSVEFFHKHNSSKSWKHERKIEMFGSWPLRFSPWDRFSIPVYETSSYTNPRFMTVSNIFPYIWSAGQVKNSGEKSGHQTNDFVFFGRFYVFRFRSFRSEPAYWIRSGILIKLPQPSSWSQCFFLIESHGFLKAAYQSKRSLILIRDTSKFLPIFIRFLVPQLSPGTGLLNQKSNPHFNTSLNNLVSYQYLSVFSLLNHLCGLFKRAF